MEQLRFLIGNEKRFSDYISSLAYAKRVVIVSHTDLDGIASAKVVDEVVE